MKRAFDELSDDEWENHPFQLSRVLKSQPQVKDHPHDHVMNGKSLPSIESFAFQKVTEHVPLSLVEVQSSEEEDDFVLGKRKVNRNRNKNVSVTPYPKKLEDDNLKFCQSRKNVFKYSEDDDDDFELGKSRVNKNKKKSLPLSPQKPQSLEDDDFGVGRSRMTVNRSRRLVVVDDSDDDTGTGENDSDVAQLGVVEVGTVSGDSEGADEDDVVRNALQKCYKISATLRKELYGSASIPSTSCEGYTEVEDCAAKIVTQADISAACADEDSDFQPVLKPYQLVGVNFLLLLYRKKIGGDMKANLFHISLGHGA